MFLIPYEVEDFSEYSAKEWSICIMLFLEIFKSE